MFYKLPLGLRLGVKKVFYKLPLGLRLELRVRGRVMKAICERIALKCTAMPSLFRLLLLTDDAAARGGPITVAYDPPVAQLIWEV